jgi:hypothetical protein
VQVAVTGEIDEQGNVAVRKGRNDALAAQGIKARTHVRPGLELMPRVQEPRSLNGGKIHAPLGEELVQRGAVKTGLETSVHPDRMLMS